MDEVIKQTVHYQAHDDTLTTVRTQPTEGLILERNATIRNNDLMGDLSFGRQLASIPMNLWEAGIRAGFAMNHPDPEIAEREIFRFLNSDQGKPCLLHEKKEKYFNGVALS